MHTKSDSHKVTVIVVDETHTKTITVNRKFFILLKPLLYSGIFFFLVLLFSLFIVTWNYFGAKSYQIKFVSLEKRLAKEFNLKSHTANKRLKELEAKEVELLTAEKTIQDLKKYMLQRGVNIKPQYKSSLNKGATKNAGGRKYLYAADTILNKEIKFSPVNINEIESLKLIKKIPIGYPHNGIITSVFGPRSNPFTGKGTEWHSGLDIKGTLGSNVKATADGVVIFAGVKGGYGNVIEIKHGFGYTTIYGHLSQINVKVNQKIKADDIIGKIGSTGRSTGPHLHYEVRKNNKIMNPELFLNLVVK